MIQTPDVAKLIIQSVKDGIKDAGKDIPVSVKTRVGYNRVEIDTWIPILLAENISALTIHARTRKEMSLVPADWNRIKEVVDIRNKMGVNTLIIGNGDVSSMEDGLKRASESGCDGVMIGRAMFGNPWFFDKKRKLTHGATFSIPILSRILPQKLVRKLSGDKKYSESDVSTQEKLRVLVEHCQLFEKLLLDVKSFAVMKKHFKAYTHGFPGAKELRVRLMETNSAKEVATEIDNFFVSKNR
jgi:tRNA-dihydrouridine synthase